MSRRPNIQEIIRDHYHEFSGVHPACLAVPEASDEDFDALCKSVAEIGISEPLLRAKDGSLLDGRTRLQACYLTNSEFRIVDDSGIVDEWLTVKTLNIDRRQLDTKQKAVFGLAWREHEAAKAKERQGTRNDLTSGKHFPEVQRASDKVGERVGVSGKSIDKAAVVAEYAPHRLRDDSTLEQAYKEAAQRKRSQAAKPIEAPPKPQTTITTAAGVSSPINLPQKPVFNATNDSVDWAKWTWNPVTGCLHGCSFCYAREIANSQRMAAVYPNGFEPTFHEYRLGAPANTKRPESDDPRDGRVFVCSMADLFGKWVPDKWIEKVFAACLESPEWEYLFLTKWPARYSQMPLIPKAWYGASIVQQSDVERVTQGMKKIDGTPIRWISMEPMLEPIVLGDLSWCNLVVIGGQTSTTQPEGFVPEFAPEFDWVVDVVNQCRDAGVPYYIKANLGLDRPGMRLPKSAPRV